MNRHHFAITSAPGDEYFSVGDWTRELEHIFIENCSPHSNRASFGELGVAELSSSTDLLFHGSFFTCRSFPLLPVDNPFYHH
ncbi:hypothetical protein EJB05_22904 [Eragrostis curvula]|uniref:Uncharacterized protein n=1 Tax=Eragrostis curvula TaxID=38414 RepID=A0A5J9V5K6_9POAL|nr:hypothetical protein EJB05_22904 [Eragrostis curvula]